MIEEPNQQNIKQQLMMKVYLKFNIKIAYQNRLTILLVAISELSNRIYSCYFDIQYAKKTNDCEESIWYYCIPCIFIFNRTTNATNCACNLRHLWVTKKKQYNKDTVLNKFRFVDGFLFLVHMPLFQLKSHALKLETIGYRKSTTFYIQIAL